MINIEKEIAKRKQNLFIDGLNEAQMGAFFLFMSVNQLIADEKRVYFSLTIFLIIFGGIWLKKRFTYPRIGYFKPNTGRKASKKQMLLATFITFVIFFAGFIYFFHNQHLLNTKWAYYGKYALFVLGIVLFLFLFLFLFLSLKQHKKQGTSKRFTAYTLVMAMGFIFFDYIYFFYAVIGTIALICGTITFIKFTKKYPAKYSNQQS